MLGKQNISSHNKWLEIEKSENALQAILDGPVCGFCIQKFALLPFPSPVGCPGQKPAFDMRPIQGRRQDQVDDCTAARLNEASRD